MPLALAHLWRPVIALPVLLVVAALAIRAARCVSARPMPPWSLVLCLLIAVGAGIWAGATHDEHVVLRRDAGSYALYGQQLAQQHQLPIDVQVSRLGGPTVVDDPDIAVASPGFYRQGHGTATTVVPQFLIGFPAWLSVGMWIGGWTGLFLYQRFSPLWPSCRSEPLPLPPSGRGGPLWSRWPRRSPRRSCTPAGRRTPSPRLCSL